METHSHVIYCGEANRAARIDTGIKVASRASQPDFCVVGGGRKHKSGGQGG